MNNEDQSDNQLMNEIFEEEKLGEVLARKEENIEVENNREM